MNSLVFVLALSIATIISLLVCVPVAMASTIHVPADQPTIQQAIDVAVNGDTVLVSRGTYKEIIDYKGKAITVTSASGPALTIIDGGGSSNPVITLQSGEGLSSELAGFSIRGGGASFGAGIYLLGASATIIGNYFYGNNESSGGFGAAIGGNGASPVIEDNVFWNNTCDTQFLSGVVSFVNGSSPVVANNIFHDNPCRAINMTLPVGNQPHVVNNTIFRNSVGIRVDARIPTNEQVYENNLIVSNQIGLEVDFGSAGDYPTWKNNDVFRSGTNYSGIPDQSGVAGNVSSDPSVLASNNFHLQFGSKVVDAGDSSAPGLPSTDFDGFPRIQGVAVDIGAYEFFPTKVSFSPTSLKFGGQVVGTSSSPQTVIVRNTGTRFLFIALSTSASFHQSSNCGRGLVSGASCTVKVVFKPTSVGTHKGSLRLSDNATASPQTAILSGTGI